MADDPNETKVGMLNVTNPKVTVKDIWTEKLEGTLLEDKYKILEKIGAGGMGAVFRGIDVGLQRKIAIKVMLPGAGGDDPARFIREARAQARLVEAGVPNIGGIHDFISGEEKIPAIVMEYLEGESLNLFLKINQDKLRDDKFKIRLLKLLIEIGKTLQLAHEQGVSHRDLKPENIMILNPDEETEDFNFKIIDFGLCKLEGDTNITKTSSGMGTPLWIAPEQLTNAKHAGATADQFVYAMIVVYIFLGRQHLIQDVCSIEDGYLALITGLTSYLLDEKKMRKRISLLPEHMYEPVLKALEFKPKDRFDSIGEFVDELEEFYNLAIESDAQPVRVQKPKKAKKRSKKAFVGIGVLGVVFFGLIAITVITTNQEPSKKKPQSKPQVAQPSPKPLKVTRKLPPTPAKSHRPEYDVSELYTKLYRRCKQNNPVLHSHCIREAIKPIYRSGQKLKAIYLLDEHKAYFCFWWRIRYDKNLKVECKRRSRQLKKFTYPLSGVEATKLGKILDVQRKPIRKRISAREIAIFKKFHNLRDKPK